MEGLKSSWTRWTLLGAGAGPLVGPPATATGGGPVGAGPGEAGISSVQAGLGGTLSKLDLMLGGAGRGAECGAASAAAIALAGLAKSVLGAEEWTAIEGVAGAEAWGVSMAARLEKGSCRGRFEGGCGSLKGLAVAPAALAAPGRSQELLGRSGEGARSPERAAGAAAAATPSKFPLLLRFGKDGSNCVTGRRLRRGAVDMVRAVLMLGAASTCGGGGGGAALCMAAFSSTNFCWASCFFLR